MAEADVVMAAAASAAAPVVVAAGLLKRYGRKTAVDAIDLQVRPGEIYGLIGPDGAGKSSLLKAVAGVLAYEGGALDVFGVRLDSEQACELVKDRIGLMPQGLGQNLYGDLSVEENIDYFAGLRLITGAELASRKNALLRSTRLDAFRDRPMKNLSGGMKQKLGLVCTLIHEPRLVILDEPTTGVDPVSRREFWSILNKLLKEKGITALVSTAYMDEASRFHRVSLMHNGKMLASGEPEQIKGMAAGCIVRTVTGQQAEAVRLLAARYAQIETLGRELRVFVDGADPEAARAGVEQVLQGLPGLQHTPCEVLEAELEDVFIALLRQRQPGAAAAPVAPPGYAAPAAPAAREGDDGLAIEADGLTRLFGAFKASDNVSFRVPRGQIFGLLGANGAGKSTVIKMLTGILSPSSGHGRVAGADMHGAGRQIRERIGYMSQAFSLYLDLTVMENIRLYGGIYGLGRSALAGRIDWILDMAGLRPFAQELSGSLPMGLRQRLALGCALIHRPQVLFLDEPTSGVDPLGRRAFWETLFRLSREEKVTILVTTHYMSEAEHCDHIALMYAGKVVADASPDEMKAGVEREAGKLFELSCAQPQAVLEALHGMGFASAALFGPRIHLLSPAPETDLPRIEAGLRGQGLALERSVARRLSMEDVFVHIVTGLDAAAHAQKGQP